MIKNERGRTKQTFYLKPCKFNAFHQTGSQTVCRHRCRIATVFLKRPFLGQADGFFLLTRLFSSLRNKMFEFKFQKRNPEQKYGDGAPDHPVP
jgi:hypothetical protein